MLLLIINGYLGHLLTARKKSTSEEAGTSGSGSFMTFVVEGMTCSHCKASVEDAALGIPGIEEASADPGKNLLSIRGDRIEEGKLRAEIEARGYKFKGKVFRF